MQPLDARIANLIAGNSVSDSRLHVIFIGLEVLKFVSLLGAGILASK